MKSYVTTATGKKFDVDRCFSSQFGDYKLLRIFFYNYTFMEIVSIFYDLNENKTIDFYDAEINETFQFKGFSTLLSANYSIEDNGMIISLTTQRK